MGLPLRILMIEDDLLDAKLVRRNFRQTPLAVEFVEAADGATGLRYSKAERFDCILLDYRLPDLDGLDVLCALTGDSIAYPIPVVVLTGQGDETVAVEFMKHGAQDYLIKEHLTPSILQRAVVNAIEKAELNRQIKNQQRALLQANADLSTVNQRLRDEVREREQAELQLRAFLESAPDATIIVNRSGAIEYVNAQTEALFGYPRDELLGKPVERLLPARFANGHERHRQSFFAVPSPRPMGNGRQLYGLTKDGREFPLEVSLNAIPTARGMLVAAAVRDITERKRAELALFKEKERAQVTLASIGDAVITTNAHGRVDYLNPAAEALTGWPLAEAAGCPLTQVFHIIDEQSRNPVANPINRCLAENRAIARKRGILLLSRDGEERHIKDTAAPIHDRYGKLLGSVLVFNDITESRQLQREIIHRATHDALTGLVNRREFEQRLQGLIEKAVAEGSDHALCYLDLDQFKVVNDTCGHAAGDELLRQIAGLFLTQVRSCDTLGRLGGDEFGVLLEYCTPEHAKRVANGLRRTVEAFRFGWENKSFAIGVSIGLVPIDARAETVNAVLGAADGACYVAKDAGRNRVHVYRDDDQEVTRRYGEMQWVEKITRALEEDRLQLAAQPIVPLTAQAGQGVHVELLLRMIDDSGQVVLPEAFMPAAERYNLAAQLDRWVVAKTLHWLAESPAPADRPDLCAMNLSGQSLGDETFLAYVIEELDKTGVAAAYICFEITETAAIVNLANATHFIATLKSLGCRFALDDFGSGLSSFGYLKNLAVDFLKIDGLFVKDIVDDPIDFAMVRAINEIAQLMGKQTIAEFVENKDILAKLHQIGVDYAQGYGIGRPLPIDDLFVNSRR